MRQMTQQAATLAACLQAGGESFCLTKTRQVGISLLSSSPNTMSAPAGCATRTAAICLPCFCATVKLWNGSAQPAPWWACSTKGIAPWKKAILAAGDAVSLFTDGMTEALNNEGEEFGEERLLEAARQNCQLPLPELLVAVADQARRFSPDEQVTTSR